jgi:hypothetical protein
MVQKNSTLARALVALCSIALTVTLAGCSTSNADMAKQAPSAVAERIAELFRNGDGDGLCEIANALDHVGACDQILSSKGVPEVVAPKPEVYGNQYRYRFYVDGFSLEYLAMDSPDSDGTYIYSDFKTSPDTVSFPYGATIGSTSLEGQRSYMIMPGGYRVKPVIKQDSSGFTQISTSENYGVETTPTAAGLKYAKEKTLSFCKEELANFKPDYSNLAVDMGIGVTRQEVKAKSALKVVTPCNVTQTGTSVIGARYSYTISFLGTGHPGSFGELTDTWTLNRSVNLYWGIDANGKLIEAPQGVQGTKDTIWQ